MKSFVAVCLLCGLFGCGHPPAPVAALPTQPVETRTPDQIAAQEIIDEQAVAKKKADRAERFEIVLQRLSEADKISDYKRFEATLLEGVATGKVSFEAVENVRQRVWSEIIAGDFHSI